MATESRDRFRKHGLELVIAGGIVSLVAVLLLGVSTAIMQLGTVMAFFNVVAIVLGAAATFSMLGGIVLLVTADRQ